MRGTRTGRGTVVGALVRGLEAMAVLGIRPLRAAAGIARRILAFGLIVLATAVTKVGRGRPVLREMVVDQVRRAGVGLLPFVGLLSVVTGVVIIGQTAAWTRQIGVEGVLSTVMVVALFREVAPLATALVVLLRVGTAAVIELTTMRATGEVEALEALSIDPVHFLVLPRVMGLAISVFCLTVYYMLGALAGGYAFCFVQQLPLSITEYLGQLARALTWLDFLLLFLKTCGFGAAIGVITCYHGLAYPRRLEEVPETASRAVTHGVAFCVLLDVLFLGLYFLS